MVLSANGRVVDDATTREGFLGESATQAQNDDGRPNTTSMEVRTLRAVANGRVRDRSNCISCAHKQEKTREGENGKRGGDSRPNARQTTHRDAPLRHSRAKDSHSPSCLLYTSPNPRD